MSVRTHEPESCASANSAIPAEYLLWLREGFWWAGVDSNHRSLRRQIYSLLPLATREPTHVNDTIFPARERRWSRRRDLNPQPADYKSAALPIELHQQMAQSKEKMATRKGLEPSTSSVTGWHSKPTELPGRVMVGLQGLEPGTNRL